MTNQRLTLPVATLLLMMAALPVAAQLNMELRDVLTYPERMSDVWGWADTTNGKEYAITGVYNGTSLVDVSNPDSISELFFIPGQVSTWRDMKTWDHYAYVTNESGGGLLIINLENLPDSISYSRWVAGDSSFYTAHNIYIDEQGYGYLWGYNNAMGNLPYDNRGALIIDIAANPEDPTVLGSYTNAYCHDGFVRGDTMWSSEITMGHFGVVDVSDRSAPVLLADSETPNRFTHNCWLSDDGQTLYTTDERSGAYIAAYDVSDLSDIEERYRWQADPGTGLIPHNTHVIGDYLVTSYYKYGVTISDASNPDVLVEVGHYDTSPFPSSDGFAGCWGAYPYLPSGNILVTDIQQGLFVFTPTYQQGCYLDGTVTWQGDGSPLNNVRVEILGTTYQTNTLLDGSYMMGTATPGDYDIRFFQNGCYAKIITNVNLQSGVTNTVDAELDCFSLTTGINEPESAVSFSAAPSPFTTQTSVRYQLGNRYTGEAVTISLYTMQGQQLNSYTMDTPAGEVVFGNGLNKGLYIVALQAGTHTQTIKLLKQ